MPVEADLTRTLRRRTFGALPLILWAAIVIVAACSGADALDARLGGDTTRDDASLNAFGLPAPGLSNEERRLFEIGDSFFTQSWVTAPASTDARDGLGPVFNAAACSSCHVLDGRGSPPDPTGEQATLGLLLRLSVPGADPTTGAPLPDPTYGDQLQDNAILGVEPEGTIEIDWADVTGTYADGTEYTLRAPVHRVGELAFGPLADGTMIGPRLAPQVFGVGLLEAIPAESLLAAADPDDADGDGISGRTNSVWDERAGATALGRFGWKANVATVEQQVAGAFHGDIGITTSLHPVQECNAAQTACADAVTGGEPELSDDLLAAVTFYNRTLSVPALRNGDDPDVIAGSVSFDDMGCASCHTTTQVTGTSDVATLSDQTFHPYTDLLLHDMGPDLADGRPDFDASGSEWRTPPLWGLGLIDDVNGARFLLHDGRARTIEEAILWHGGEGEAAREAFRTADADTRSDLVAFLESL